MVKRIGITGPMWSGKTDQLRELAMELADGNTILGIEPIWNTRRSSRELAQVASFPVIVLSNEREHGGCGPFKDDVPVVAGGVDWAIPFADVYAFDEVHLYEVHGQLEAFIRLVFLLPGTVLLSGLWSDCYNSYDTFKVWSELVPHLNEVRVMQSRVPCAQCADPDAQYSKSTGGPKAGDSYVNVCRKCRD